MNDSIRIAKEIIQNMPDTLSLAKEIIANMPYSYWASVEPWRIIVMSFTILIILLPEPIVFACMLKYNGFLLWMKKWVEDSDENPNSIDMLNVFINWLIFFTGRMIGLAAVWHFIFHEDQITLIAALGVVMGGLITRNSINAKAINGK